MNARPLRMLMNSNVQNNYYFSSRLTNQYGLQNDFLLYQYAGFPLQPEGLLRPISTQATAAFARASTLQFGFLNPPSSVLTTKTKKAEFYLLVIFKLLSAVTFSLFCCCLNSILSTLFTCLDSFSGLLIRTTWPFSVCLNLHFLLLLILLSSNFEII